MISVWSVVEELVNFRCSSNNKRSRCRDKQILIVDIILESSQRQFLENICSEDDLRSRIFGTFVVKFLACLPLLGFSNI